MKEFKEGKIKTAVFDMDGTIYQLDGENNGFKNSTLHKNVKQNILRFVATKENITYEKAQKVVDEINTQKTFDSSLAAERYGITRKDFFDEVWNISPDSFVTNYEDAVNVINELSNRGVELILVTQAPQIWQNKVFTFIGMEVLFDEIYTAESYLHKTEVFPKIAKTREPKTVLAIGDQMETDIIPAQEQGFYTFHVTSPNDLLKLIQDEQ